MTYYYDEDNGSPQGAYGNQTSVRRWLNTTGGTLDTGTVYNGAGMPVSIIDPNLNTTAITYDGTGVFPSKIERPSTNGINHIEYFSYDANTGNLNYHTDPNGYSSGDVAHTVFYTYSDPLGRLTRIVEPSSTYGQEETDIVYSDAARTITTTVSATPDPTQVSTKTYDGLGRLIKSVAPDNVMTDTTYDLLGRVASVSNPYRNPRMPNDPPAGATSYSYDALGRIQYQCQPDNVSADPTICDSTKPNTSYLEWVYSGNSTTFYDEIRNSWQRTADGFGRLTNVVEPGGLSTSYIYDSLNDLRNVNQAGIPTTEMSRARSFTYDSLSRLVCASNPENSSNACPASATVAMPTGVTKYSYDPNGNLLYKTDARGVTANYIYDPLNRLVGKWFTGESKPTLSTCYWYDAGAVPVSNSVGRLAGEWTQTGTCPTGTSINQSAAVSFRNITSYDPMGRILTEEQCALAPCTAPGQLQYFYDLAGNVTYSSNGLPNSKSPQIGFTSSYDGASHLATITSNWSDATHPAGLFKADTAINGIAPYGPFGLTAAQLGFNAASNAAALSESLNYDVRGRVANKNVLGSAIVTLIPTTEVVTMIPSPFTLGQSSMASVHVSCNTDCGDVDFRVDGNEWYGAVLDASGGAFFNTYYWANSYFTVGNHTLTVNYLGNSSYAPSSSSIPFTINPTGTQQTTVTLSMTPTVFTTGEDSVATVNVGCNSACGQVRFRIDGHDWVTWLLDTNGNTSADTFWWPSAYLTPGSHTLTADYLGNSTYAPTSSSIAFTVNPIGTQQTAVTLSMSPTAFTTGEDSVATVNVGCNSACGRVWFRIDGHEWVNWPLDASGNTSADTFWWPSAYLTPGSHTLTADYLGNSTFASASSSMAFTVNPIGTQQTAVTLSMTPTSFGAADHAVATVQVGCNSACGQVQFTIDGNQWVVFPLDANGSVSVDEYWWGSGYFTPGPHTVTAHYLGNSTYAPASSSIAVTVTP